MRELSPEIEVLKRHISRRPRVTEQAQAKLLADLLASEAEWKRQLVSAYGLKVYEYLADVHFTGTARTFFRVRQVDQSVLADQIKSQAWGEVAKLGINYKFIAWSRQHAKPRRAMLDEESKIIALRQQLVESILALILRQAIAFKKASKTHHATVAELVSIGAAGVLDAIDKYTPDGAISARVWKSTALGRISGEHVHYISAQTPAHLYPKDERRLAKLRGGRVKEEDVTLDDLRLLNLGNVLTIATTAASINDNGHVDGLDLVDGKPNVEEAAIAAEDERERRQEHEAQKLLDVPLRSTQLRYPWEEMEVGKSFFVPFGDQEFTVGHSLTASIKKRRLRHGELYAVRAYEDGLRVWRVK